LRVCLRSISLNDVNLPLSFPWSFFGDIQNVSSVLMNYGSSQVSYI
jgi:hypothetical protein